MVSFLKQFLNFKYLFSLRPLAVDFSVLKILLTVFGILVILAVVFKTLAFKYKNDWLVKRGWEKMFALFLTMGLTGLVYTFFLYEGAALVSARFWLVIWIIVLLTWLFYNLFYLLIQVPRRKREIAKKRNFEKYFP